MADDGNKTELPRVISFPPSSDCENGRWILDLYGIKYNEERHAPPFVFLALPLNLGYQFPLFINGDVRLNGARRIIDYFEARLPKEKKLIPDESAEENNRLWNGFNGEMNSATVSWAYYHLLPHKEIMLDPLSIGTPDYERWTVKNLYPLPKGLLWLLLGLTEKKADDALSVLKKHFAEVDAKLADGRPYVSGDRKTIADIAFAVAGAPLVLPRGYGGYPGKPGPLPSFEQAPPEMQSVVTEMRQSLAGKFIMRLYENERYPSA